MWKKTTDLVVLEISYSVFYANTVQIQQNVSWAKHTWHMSQQASYLMFSNEPDKRWQVHVDECCH